MIRAVAHHEVSNHPSPHDDQALSSLRLCSPDPSRESRAPGDAQAPPGRLLGTQARVQVRSILPEHSLGDTREASPVRAPRQPLRRHPVGLTESSCSPADQKRYKRRAKSHLAAKRKIEASEAADRHREEQSRLRMARAIDRRRVNRRAFLEFMESSSSDEISDLEVVGTTSHGSPVIPYFAVHLSHGVFSLISGGRAP